VIREILLTGQIVHELVREGEETLRMAASLPRELKRAMSQRKLADAAGISQRAIVDLETDRREPHPSTLGKLVNALGVKLSELLED
jgi:DNA-binding XRE family transcriptional regulator